MVGAGKARGLALGLTGVVAILVGVLVVSRGDSDGGRLTRAVVATGDEATASTTEPSITEPSTTTERTTTSSVPKTTTTTQWCCEVYGPEAMLQPVEQAGPVQITMRRPYRVEDGMGLDLWIAVDTGGSALCDVEAGQRGTAWEHEWSNCSQSGYCPLVADPGRLVPASLHGVGSSKLEVKVVSSADRCAHLEVSRAVFNLDVVPIGGHRVTPAPLVRGEPGKWTELQAALDAARSRWQAAKPSGGYWRRTTLTCYCPIVSDITSVDGWGVVVESRSVGGAPGHRSGVEEDFRTIQRMIDENYDAAYAGFDPDTGVPTTWGGGQDREMPDGGQTVTTDWMGPRPTS